MKLYISKKILIFRRSKIKCVLIKLARQFLLFIVIFLLNSCVTQFFPELNEEKELLVVEGLITDQPGTNTVKLSKSLPLGVKTDAKPLTGCNVKISDDKGNIFNLTERDSGVYVTDPETFKGEIGRFYTLHVTTNTGTGTLNFESYPTEMKPVPPIDSIYYEKTVIEASYLNFKGIDGCQIYLNTHDPENKCRFYRWDYSETWLFRLNYEVPNQTCWISDNSNTISIRSTAAYEESVISRLPVTYISNVTDRLKTKYSILVNQYSLNEDEYIYWDEIQNIAVKVGGLYDMIPASVPSNIHCIENPAEKVLGYFSVSARSSKRIFIKDNFEGIIDRYAKCITDTVYSSNFPGLNISAWILFIHPCGGPPCIPFWEITTRVECSDCTLRGTTTKPLFWQDDK